MAASTHLMELLLSWDIFVFRLINQSMQNPVFDWLMPRITDLHKNNWTLGALVVLVFLILWQKFSKKAFGYLVFIILAVGVCDWFSGQVIKPTFDRERPTFEAHSTVQRSPHFGGAGFVSNHAANLFCLSFLIASLIPKWRSLFYSIATLVAFSRVYNGVHFPADVIAGGFYGTFVGWLFIKLLNQVQTLRKT